MTIIHKHPIYSDEMSKAEAINKKFNAIYSSIVERRGIIADGAMAV